MPARSEPLLWVQLIGGGLLPLQALLLLLLLAGADPGPVPALERLLCWGLGGLATTLLLWHRPADVWSLLLLQTPLRGRRPLQQRLSRLQEALPPRIGLVFAGLLSLPGLWWLDDHAAVAAPFSPLAGSPRLVVLVLAASLLAVMVWQWQQLLQALWLLSRSPEAVAAARPLAQAELEEQRICLGLPLLLLEPLRLDPVPPAVAVAAPAGVRVPPAAPPEPPAEARVDEPPDPAVAVQPDAAEPEAPADSGVLDSPPQAVLAVQADGPAPEADGPVAGGDGSEAAAATGGVADDLQVGGDDQEVPAADGEPAGADSLGPSPGQIADALSELP